MLLPAALELLHVKRVVVPPHPGLFSALGLLSTDLVYYDSRSAYVVLSPETAPMISTVFEDMEQRLRERAGIGKNGVAVRRSFDGRLLGQSWETPFVEVPEGPITEETIPDLIEPLPRRVRAALRESLRVRAGPGRQLPRRARRPGREGRVPGPARSAPRSSPSPIAGSSCVTSRTSPLTAGEYERERLPAGARVRGPAIIREALSTTLVCPGQTAEVGPLRRARHRGGMSATETTQPGSDSRPRRRGARGPLRLRPLHGHRAREPLSVHRRAHVRPAPHGRVLAHPARLLRLRGHAHGPAGDRLSRRRR